MNLTAINSMRQTRAAKPWANEEAKRKEEADIKSEVEEYLDKGNKVEVLPSFGVRPKYFTYKQKNDSTYTA